jgi:hypothetical protein
MSQNQGLRWQTVPNGDIERQKQFFALANAWRTLSAASCDRPQHRLSPDLKSGIAPAWRPLGAIAALIVGSTAEPTP